MNLAEPRFNDETAARQWLEAQRWPDGRTCPHCGNADEAMITGLKGKAHRPGVYQCNACREQFTVTVGTVMERSKLPLTKWVMATQLMASSKKGVSAHQLHRILGITYQSAWFMAHRLREAMRPLPGSQGPMGGEGKVVEADETYFGKADEAHVSPTRKGRPYTKRKAGSATKMAVVSLVERGGTVRSFHPATANKADVTAIVKANIAKETRFMTDESRIYKGLSAHFAAHLTVKHSAGEYVRLDDRSVHSNTVENFFSVFKRGMKGIYQHCAEKHLHRYLAEFDFRYNTRAKLGYSDYERACALASGIAGKRLTYRRTDEAGRYLHG